MAPTLLIPPPLPTAWPEAAILTGHLAPASLAKYHQALRAYLAFCETPAQAFQATSLARWRTHLAQHTRLSPHTINRLLAAVKRLVKEAAAQGYVDVGTAMEYADGARQTGHPPGPEGPGAYAHRDHRQALRARRARGGPDGRALLSPAAGSPEAAGQIRGLRYRGPEFPLASGPRVPHTTGTGGTSSTPPTDGPRPAGRPPAPWWGAPWPRWTPAPGVTAACCARARGGHGGGVAQVAQVAQTLGKFLLKKNGCAFP
jgi:hypothetical protein